VLDDFTTGQFALFGVVVPQYDGVRDSAFDARGENGVPSLFDFTGDNNIAGIDGKLRLLRVEGLFDQPDGFDAVFLSIGAVVCVRELDDFEGSVMSELEGVLGQRGVLSVLWCSFVVSFYHKEYEGLIDDGGKKITVTLVPPFDSWTLLV